MLYFSTVRMFRSVVFWEFPETTVFHVQGDHSIVSTKRWRHNLIGEALK